MKKKNITESKYWKYKDQKIKYNFLSNFIKAVFEKFFGLKIIKKKKL